MPKPSPTHYRTTNWSDYNAALRKRGSLSVWFDPEMVWHAGKTGKRGRPETFSDAAIQTCLTLKVLFGLPLRHMVGMIESLIQMAGLDWPVPDYSTLCRRQARIAVQVPYRTSGQPLDLLVDSTGIKFRGDGAWQARKHGPSRRRQWRKVHIAMDAGTGDVRAVEFTSSRQGDSPSLPDLLAQIPPEEAIGRSPQTVPMIHDDAMARSLTETPKRPYRSVAMVALGKKTVPLLPRETRSCGQPGAWAGRSGRRGPAITSEVGSRL
jgi:hypothetical protein